MKGNTDVLVDPLKLRTYGVKKGLNEKEQKIKDLYDQNRRYYPTNNKGTNTFLHSPLCALALS